MSAISTQDANRIGELVESGDLYGAMLRLGRMWLEKDHPSALNAVLVVENGQGEPSTQVVILPSH